MIRSTSYLILFGLRSIPIGGATDADALAYSHTLKMYPLSEAANPKPTRFVDGRLTPLRTLPFYTTLSVSSQCSRATRS